MIQGQTLSGLLRVQARETWLHRMLPILIVASEPNCLCHGSHYVVILAQLKIEDAHPFVLNHLCTSLT